MVIRKAVEPPSDVHYEQFWGDDPYLICSNCDRIRDAMTGAVPPQGRRFVRAVMARGDVRF